MWFNFPEESSKNNSDKRKYLEDGELSLLNSTSFYNLKDLYEDGNISEESVADSKADSSDQLPMESYSDAQIEKYTSSYAPEFEGKISCVVITENAGLTLNGIYNTANFTIDLSLVPGFAGCINNKQDATTLGTNLALEDSTKVVDVLNNLLSNQANQEPDSP